MDVFFAEKDLAKMCASGREMQRRLGVARAKRLGVRLQQLRLADSLAEMRLVTTRIHELSGDLSGCIALDLDGPYRLIIEPVEPVEPAMGGDGRLDWAAVRAVLVVQIVDYH